MEEKGKKRVRGRHIDKQAGTQAQSERGGGGRRMDLTRNQILASEVNAR